jgi:hypothetical protein
MESFIQEEGNVANGEPSANDNQAPADNGGNNQAPAADNNNTSTNNNGDAKANENKPMTDAERKAYNKEHWVRMKTKKGKLENIFVSIIAFIPRLLGFLIQSIVRLFKKIGNKDTEKKAQDIANASPEAKKKAAEQVGETVDASKQASASAPAADNNNSAPQNNQNPPTNSPANSNPSNPQQPTPNANPVPGAVNVQKATTTWYDDSVITAIQGFSKIIKDLDIRANGAEDPKNMEDLNTYVQMFNGVQEQLKADLPPVRQALEEAFKKDWIEVEIGPALDDKKNRMTRAFGEVKDAAANLIGGENSKHQNVQGVYSDIVNKLKAIIDKETENAHARESGNNKLLSTIQPLKDVIKAVKDMIATFNVRENNLAEAYANYSKNIDTVWNALQGTGQQNNYNYQYDPNRAANNNNNNPQGGENNNGGENQNNN